MELVFFFIILPKKYTLSRKYGLSPYYAPPLFFVIKQDFLLDIGQQSQTVLKHKKVSLPFALALN